MPKNPQEFVTFLAGHFRPLEAMCRQHARFSSDTELAAFLKNFEAEEKSLTRLIGRMKELGVLVELAGEWSPPSFLSDFVQKLADRHALASPSVIRSWIDSLRSHVTELSNLINSQDVHLGTLDLEAARFRLREIADIFHTIVGTVEDNCLRIASEVAEYRVTEGASKLRSRLDRLILLHDEYLDPIIQIVNVTGDFYAVTDQIAKCCARLSFQVDGNATSISEEARFIAKDVIWLRRVIIQRAEEARRELGPLCEAAVRESKIAKGVNRALEAIRKGDWSFLDLERNLSSVDERDGTLFGDLAIERYIRIAKQASTAPPPLLPVTAPSSLQLPVSPDDVLDRLDGFDSIEDLFAWLLDLWDDIDLNIATQLFHSVLENSDGKAQPTNERQDHERGNLVVNATRWTWNRGKDGDRDHSPDSGRPARKTRKRVPAT